MNKDIQINRPTLGPFMSVTCFRYLHDDALDMAGPALVTDAGRQRGHDLIEELGLLGSKPAAAHLQEELLKALGPDGTRLCLLQNLKETEDGGYEVRSKECVSPTYTVGVLVGAISAVTGQTFIGSHAEGATPDERVYSIKPL